MNILRICLRAADPRHTVHHRWPLFPCVLRNTVYLTLRVCVFLRVCMCGVGVCLRMPPLVMVLPSWCQKKAGPAFNAKDLEGRPIQEDEQPVDIAVTWMSWHAPHTHTHTHTHTPLRQIVAANYKMWCCIGAVSLSLSAPH